jgi:UDP-N-acetylglucosamine 2-epimerase
VAKSRGVQSVYVQHGVVVPRHVYASFMNDMLCFWGNYEESGFTSLGVQPQAIHVTGSPLYDSLAMRARQVQPRADGSVRIVMFASRSGGAHTSLDVARTTIAAVAGLAAVIDNAEVIIKAHPADNTQIPEEAIRKLPRVRLVRTGSSQDLVLNADIVVVVSSTTGFEACVADKPLIVLNFTDEEMPLGFAASGAAIEVDSPEGLLGAVHSIRTDGAVRQSLAEGRRRVRCEMLNGADGNAGERIASVIREASSRYVGTQAAAQ